MCWHMGVNGSMKISCLSSSLLSAHKPSYYQMCDGVITAAMKWPYIPEMGRVMLVIIPTWKLIFKKLLWRWTKTHWAFQGYQIWSVAYQGIYGVGSIYCIVTYQSQYSIFAKAIFAKDEVFIHLKHPMKMTLLWFIGDHKNRAWH